MLICDTILRTIDRKKRKERKKPITMQIIHFYIWPKVKTIDILKRNETRGQYVIQSK